MFMTKNGLYINEKGTFKKLFSPGEILSEKDRIWMNWIIDECLGKEDEAFKILYLNNGNKIHPQFAELILRKLMSGDKDISDIVYKDYIIILDSYIKTSWEIFRLIEILSRRRLYSLCYKLFMKYFEVQFVLENKPLYRRKELTYNHIFIGNRYYIEQSWQHCKNEFLALYAEKLMYFIKDTISNIYDTYMFFIEEDNAIEFRRMSMLVIEERDDYSKRDPLYLLCNIFCACCKAWKEKNPKKKKEFLIKCLRNPSALLKKLSLKALRECESISSCEKYDIFINNSTISFFEGREQIFLLIKEIFNDLTENRQDKLIDEIESLDTNKSEYPIYNWCVWIKQFCHTNERINKLEEEILSRNNFRPREHPELDIVVEQVVWSGVQSPITQEQMLGLDLQQLIDLLNNYNGESFEGPSRDGMLSVFSECVKTNYYWTSKVIQKFIDCSIEKADAWQRLLIGIQDSNFGAEQLIEVLKQFAEKMEIVKDIHGMSELLLRTLKRNEIKEYFHDRENELFLIMETIWNHRNKNYINSDRLIDIVINSDLGNVLLSSIYMLSYCDKEQGIPERYKDFWEKNLNLKDKEKDISLCVLAGNFNFLYLRDQKWCESNYIEVLSGVDQQSFAAAWEGIVYFSHYLNKNMADVMEPIFLKAIRHLNWLAGEARDGFIDLYLLLLIYAVDDPCLEHIPTFYGIAGEHDKERFIEKIEHKLRGMDDEKESFWKDWLRQFLLNRYENIPVKLEDKEKVLFITWLPELGQFFEEAVNIICKERMPRQVDSLFLYRLDESKAVLQYPHSVISLLTQMLNDGTKFDFYRDYISNIYKEAEGLLSQEEKAAFKEAFLKRGMDI